MWHRQPYPWESHDEYTVACGRAEREYQESRVVRLCYLITIIDIIYLSYTYVRAQ